jgi:hypothetical protein
VPTAQHAPARRVLAWLARSSLVRPRGQGLSVASGITTGSRGRVDGSISRRAIREIGTAQGREVRADGETIRGAGLGRAPNQELKPGADARLR